MGKRWVHVVVIALAVVKGAGGDSKGVRCCCC